MKTLDELYRVLCDGWRSDNSAWVTAGLLLELRWRDPASISPLELGLYRQYVSPELQQQVMQTGVVPFVRRLIAEVETQGNLGGLMWVVDRANEVSVLPDVLACVASHSQYVLDELAEDDSALDLLSVLSRIVSMPEDAPEGIAVTGIWRTNSVALNTLVLRCQNSSHSATADAAKNLAAKLLARGLMVSG